MSIVYFVHSVMKTRQWLRVAVIGYAGGTENGGSCNTRRCESQEINHCNRTQKIEENNYFNLKNE